MLTIRPTRISPLLRLRMAIRGAYLRHQIRAHERDIKNWDRDIEIATWELEHRPLQQRLANQQIDVLRVQLIDCELCTRTN